MWYVLVRSRFKVKENQCEKISEIEGKASKKPFYRTRNVQQVCEVSSRIKKPHDSIIVLILAHHLIHFRLKNFF